MHGMRSIVTGAVVVLALALSTESPLAQDRLSPRIYSLGGYAVSGIIPDFYTDLSINPAYACLAERLTLNYGRRDASGFDMTFPFLSRDTYYGSASSFYSGTNEFSIYGINISGWRAALCAQWYLSQSERNLSPMELGESTSGPYIFARNQYRSDDADLGRIDLVAARPVGDRSVVGFRLQGRGYYDSYSNIDSQEENWFADYSFLEILQKNIARRADSNHGRELCFDFQTGLARRSGAGITSELVLSVSRSQLDYQKQDYDLNIREEYYPAQELYDYYYDRELWSDAREGSLWTYGLSLRHALRGGIRIYSGGSLSRGSYDTEWIDSEKVIDWNRPNVYDETVSGEFAGTGSQWEAKYFLKGGRTFKLLETLDLTIGLCGDFRRTHAEEFPVIHYSQSLGEEDTLRIDQPSSLDYTGTFAYLYVPLSVEFRPASYFTFFSGFTVYGKWSKSVTERPAISQFYIFPPHSASIPGGVSRASASGHALVIPETSLAEWERAWYTGNTVTLGFSLHYRDRFFIDVYSESEIIPNLSSDQMIDVRYVF